MWTADVGRYELPREEFLRELVIFDRRLMEAMGSRVRAATVDWPRSDVRIDFKHLEAEQVERGGWLSSAVRNSRRATDWRAVRDVLSQADIRGSA